ncbi:MAG: hypothetical protein M3177_01715 [Pseudomonadota bacterium]|nr:hypothetical protein [Pseudomonadota bacterium]
MTATTAFALLAASLSGSYSCGLERQVVVTENGSEQTAVSFPEADRDSWRFGIGLAGEDAGEVVVNWPANPIQIAGTYPILPVAPGQVAFVAVSEGPCMFTEQACAALVEISARDDGSAAVSILPSGSVRDPSGRRSLFHVVFIGTCRRTNEVESR